jgi:hypothetical protein
VGIVSKEVVMKSGKLALLLAAWFLVGARSSEALDSPPIPSQPIDMDRDGEADFYLQRMLNLNNVPTWVRQETLQLGTYDPFDPYARYEGRIPSANGNSALAEAGAACASVAGGRC